MKKSHLAVNEPLIFVWNLPNYLTAARVLLTIVSAGLLLANQGQGRLIAGILLIIAWGTDWLDGFLARRLGLSSLAGAIFDLIADRLMMTGISVITVYLGFWTRTAGLMPWAPYPYLVVVWAADLALLTGIVVFLVRRQKVSLPFPGPTLVIRLAFPIQMLTLVLAILHVGPDWLIGGLMYLTILSTLIASYSYLKKGGYIFTAG
jgi:phosphatidylglycerophosphate synthase